MLSSLKVSSSNFLRKSSLRSWSPSSNSSSDVICSSTLSSKTILSRSTTWSRIGSFEFVLA